MQARLRPIGSKALHVAEQPLPPARLVSDMALRRIAILTFCMWQEAEDHVDDPRPAAPHAERNKTSGQCYCQGNRLKASPGMHKTKHRCRLCHVPSTHLQTVSEHQQRRAVGDTFAADVPSRSAPNPHAPIRQAQTDMRPRQRSVIGEEKRRPRHQVLTPCRPRSRDGDAPPQSNHSPTSQQTERP